MDANSALGNYTVPSMPVGDLVLLIPMPQSRHAWAERVEELQVQSLTLLPSKPPVQSKSFWAPADEEMSLAPTVPGSVSWHHDRVSVLISQLVIVTIAQRYLGIGR